MAIRRIQKELQELNKDTPQIVQRVQSQIMICLDGKQLL